MQLDPDICLLVRDVLIVALAAVVVLIVLLLIAPSATARPPRKRDRRPLAVLGQGDTRRCIWPAQVAAPERDAPGIPATTATPGTPGTPSES